MLNKLLNLLCKSVLDRSGKVSSSRISSYVLLLMIVLASLVFLAIDITNLINSGGAYVIPTEHVLIFGMLLTHHLMLLGIKKSAEEKNK